MPWVELDLSEDASDFVSTFRKSPRFLLDEDVTAEFAEYLREGGYNVRTVAQAGLRGRSDEEVFRFAKKDRRILFTRNGRDFWSDARFPLEQTAGIVVLGSEEPAAAIYALRIVGGPWADAWVGVKFEFGAGGEYKVKQRNFDTGAVTTRRCRFAGYRKLEEWFD